MIIVFFFKWHFEKICIINITFKILNNEGKKQKKNK